MIESQRKVGKAETLLKKALNTGLRTDQDKALAKLNLVGIALTKRRKKEAQILLLLAFGYQRCACRANQIHKATNEENLKDSLTLLNYLLNVALGVHNAILCILSSAHNAFQLV